MIGALILSRTGSRRLPNKALLQLGNKSLIEWPIDVLKDLEGVMPILTTTSKPEDDRLEGIAIEKGIDFFRGSEDDVAERILACCEQFNLTHFFRVNGDSPFLNVPLMKEAIELLKRQDVDLISNLIKRTHPYGIACELIKVSSFKSVYKQFNSAEKEHITKYMYDNLDQFEHKELDPLPSDYGNIALTVDTREDLERLNSFSSKNTLNNINKAPILEVISEYLRCIK